MTPIASKARRATPIEGVWIRALELLVAEDSRFASIAIAKIGGSVEDSIVAFTGENDALDRLFEPGFRPVVRTFLRRALSEADTDAHGVLGWNKALEGDLSWPTFSIHLVSCLQGETEEPSSKATTPPLPAPELGERRGPPPRDGGDVGLLEGLDKRYQRKEPKPEYPEIPPHWEERVEATGDGPEGACSDCPPDPERFRRIGKELGELVATKNAAYGNAFNTAGKALRLLYPEGIRPEQFDDALAIVRIWDKLQRIATARDALGESPYRDVAGYGILGAERAER